MIIARRENEFTARAALRIHGIILGIGMVFVGIQFLRPPNTFTAPIYKAMSDWGTEDAWGRIMVLLGGGSILAILYGAKRDPHIGATIASFVLSGCRGSMWFAMAILFYQVNPVGWSCVAAALLAALDFSTCFMVAKMVRTTREATARGAARGLGRNPS